MAEPVGPDVLARFPDLPPLIVQLLHNRNIRDAAAAQDFLSGRFVADDPFQLKGMDRAVDRLQRAIRHRERLAVYGDFDADGVTATALLVEVLNRLGAQAEPYIPHRIDEGYGLHSEALRKLRRQGLRLVVTVDCGIRSVAEVEEARPEMDVIVTDHHSPGSRLPPAYAIINPKQPDCRYPFDGLAGVGLAFKLAQALVTARRGQGDRDGPLADVLDLVALGTVADLSPIIEENRVLVLRGLDTLNRARRPGISALLVNAGVRPGEVDVNAVGFRLAPRLNAAGRLESPMLAYDLLTNTNLLETGVLAGRLGELNRKRQELTEQTVAAAEAQVLAEHPEARLYLAQSASFNPGIVGLAASRLVELYYRPAVVVELGPKESRGSCRSIPEFHITEALDRCEDLLIRYGGHRAAAGFTVETHKLDALHRRLGAIAAEKLAGVELRPVLDIDAVVPLEEVTPETFHNLARLQPCGPANPPPLFASRSVQVREAKTVGAAQQHLRLVVRDRRGISWDAMLFGCGRLAERLPPVVDLAYHLEQSAWNGTPTLRLVVQDVRPAEGY